MLSIDIPGYGILEIEHLVLDVNGTIAHDGVVLEGVAEQIAALAPVVRISAVTADTYGCCSHIADTLDIAVRVIERGREAESKLDYIDELGADRVVAIGNGANDELMLRAAGVGIAVVGGEGCSAAAAAAADVLVRDVTDALGLLVDPKRLIATLRR